MPSGPAGGGRRLESAGAHIHELDLPEPFGRLHDAQRLMVAAEGQGAFLPLYLGPQRPLLDSPFVDIVENRQRITPEQLVAT